MISLTTIIKTATSTTNYIFHQPITIIKLFRLRLSDTLNMITYWYQKEYVKAKFPREWPIYQQSIIKIF